MVEIRKRKAASGLEVLINWMGSHVDSWCRFGDLTRDLRSEVRADWTRQVAVRRAARQDRAAARQAVAVERSERARAKWLALRGGVARKSPRLLEAIAPPVARPVEVDEGEAEGAEREAPRQSTRRQQPEAARRERPARAPPAERGAAVRQGEVVRRALEAQRAEREQRAAERERRSMERQQAERAAALAAARVSTRRMTREQAAV